jgi:hypothetical protein
MLRQSGYNDWGVDDSLVRRLQSGGDGGREPLGEVFAGRSDPRRCTDQSTFDQANQAKRVQSGACER